MSILPFPGPVGAKHTKKFPGMDFNVQRMKGDEVTVFFGHVFGADHRPLFASHGMMKWRVDLIPCFAFIANGR